ncbi:MAG TPA: hypothetical protein VH120_13560 [Gemmataceae bacterium]|nr:hypothetical protein [Gemmataceae bacterium]
MAKTGIGLARNEQMASHFRIEYAGATLPALPAKVKVKVVDHIDPTKVWLGVGKCPTGSTTVLYVKVHCESDGGGGTRGGGETGTVDITITDAATGASVANADVPSQPAVYVT